MSYCLDRALDSVRRCDCLRNDEAIRRGAPVTAPRFECVEAVSEQVQEQNLECCDD